MPDQRLAPSGAPGRTSLSWSPAHAPDVPASLSTLLAARASRSISAVSAFSSLGSIFVARSHRLLDLGAHVGHADDHQTGLAGVEVLAELLEVVAAHAGRGMTGDRAEDRSAGGRRREQAAADRGEREQRDDQAGGQPDAAAEHAADPRRRLVLLGDLGLAVVAALDTAAS